MFGTLDARNFLAQFRFLNVINYDLNRLACNTYIHFSLLGLNSPLPCTRLWLIYYRSNDHQDDKSEGTQTRGGWFKGWRRARCSHYQRVIAGQMAHDRGKREWTKYRMPERFICGLICAEVQIHSCKTNIVATYSSRTCSPTCSAGGGSTHVKRREFTKKKRKKENREGEGETEKKKQHSRLVHYSRSFVRRI